MIELPKLKLEKKVKSIQMFHRPVNQAGQVSIIWFNGYVTNK